MAVNLTLRATQPIAGAPITISGVMHSNNPADQTQTFYLGVGVTLTSAPPTTFASFAHVDGLTAWIIGEPYWITEQEVFEQSFSAGVRLTYSDDYRVGTVQRLDANYVAGRFLWLVLFDDAHVPAGADPVTAHSSAYTII